MPRAKKPAKPKAKKEGKPAKYGPDKEAFLIALEAKAGNISHSCKAIGISRRTFYNWMDSDEVFSAQFLEVREGLIDFAEATLLTLIKEKQPAATIFFLKTQARHRGYLD